jgi:hypothetical protein
MSIHKHDGVQDERMRRVTKDEAATLFSFYTKNGRFQTGGMCSGAFL